MTLTIIYRDETREVKCATAEVKDSLLFVYIIENGLKKVKQIWNMINIIGVEMEEQ